MSDVTPAAEQPQGAKLRKYLTFMLNASPQDESERIVYARMKAMRLVEEKPRAVAAAQEVQEGLQAANVLIEELRESIWTKPQEELQQVIASIEVQKHVHLRPVLDRFDTILRNRDQLTLLLDRSKKSEQSFLQVFRDVLTAPPQQRAELRERARTAFMIRKLRRAGLKTLKKIEEIAPEVSVLEADWISQLRERKGRLGDDIPIWFWLALAAIINFLFIIFGDPE